MLRVKKNITKKRKSIEILFQIWYNILIQKRRNNYGNKES